MMSAETIEARLARNKQWYRSAHPAPSPSWRMLNTWFAPTLVAMMAALVLLGGASLDLGPADAELGLAARGSLGPLGRVFGYWKPGLWPGKVALSALAAQLMDRRQAAPGSVLWPEALGAAAIGWMLARRLKDHAGTRAGLLFGFCWFGCLGVIDHSGATGLEFMSGLATVAALDRLLEKGSGWSAGLWSAAALLTGGWPPMAIILLAVIVIGRPHSGISWRLLMPPAAALFGWSTWVLSVASPEALAAALALPFTRPSAWWLGPKVIVLGLPFAPVAALGFSRSLRSTWTDATRSSAIAWSQVAIASLIAGTIVPGLAGSAAVPALAGILFAAAAALDSAWSRTFLGGCRQGFLILAFGIALLWLMIVVYGEPFCLLMVSYYRAVGIVVLLFSTIALVISWQALRGANTRRAVVALALVTVAFKFGHLGVFVPEWNYQHGQGPWGRAIGQWLIPSWPVYTIHEWPHDLAFAIGRPIRQLATPQHLSYQGERGLAKHVLLLESEYDHWPADAPRVIKVAEFHDRCGALRILARTEGLLMTPSGALIAGERSGPRRRTQ
jgi:hypothetical protein